MFQRGEAYPSENCQPGGTEEATAAKRRQVREVTSPFLPHKHSGSPPHLIAAGAPRLLCCVRIGKKQNVTITTMAFGSLKRDPELKAV